MTKADDGKDWLFCEDAVIWRQAALAIGNEGLALLAESYREAGAHFEVAKAKLAAVPRVGGVFAFANEMKPRVQEALSLLPRCCRLL